MRLASIITRPTKAPPVKLVTVSACAAALMTKRSGGPLSGGDPVYRVTDAGQDALVGRPKTPNA